MRAIIQRVTSASVSVGGQQISSVGPGLCVLLGISRGDAEKDAEYICRKVLNMKLWDDAKTGKPWQQSVVRIAYLHRGPTRALQLTPLVLPTAMQMSAGYEVLFVSQFTLYAQTHKGNRPDFSKAMAPKEAKPMYEAFLTRARGDYHEDRVKDGEFGAHMLVDIANDGPVTIVLDTSELSSTEESRSGVASGPGVDAITDEDVAAWHSLPAIPKHDNKKGRPSPEHLAAAKSAKDGRRVFVERLIARICGGSGPEGQLSIKAVEVALNSCKPLKATASSREVRAKVTSPVSGALELDSAKVSLPVPQL
jgi:D-tyrosyl-tRNA(Tyr) deacylase